MELATFFDLADVDTLARDLIRRPVRTAGREVLALPDWYQYDLDPFSAAYKEQQLRLWRQVAGSEAAYEAVENEQYSGAKAGGPFSRAAIFRNGSAAHASDHIGAISNILRHSGVRAGSRVLEFGPGFGEIAFTFARLGAIVDAVDINSVYCDAINTMSRLAEVPLKAHVGLFGDNPRPGVLYDLIYFYEAFHHSADFTDLIHKLKLLLAPRGSILLAGEPIHPRAIPALPYPWGLRLDEASVATTRAYGWMELGFEETFITDLFTRLGFIWQRFETPGNALGTVYRFQRHGGRVEMKDFDLSVVDAESWYGKEAGGRWTRRPARLPLDATAATVRVSLSNHHPFPIVVCVSSGEHMVRADLAAGQAAVLEVRIDAARSEVLIDAPTFRPKDSGTSADDRELGVFVSAIEYV